MTRDYHYDKGVQDFVDFLLLKLSQQSRLEVIEAYVAWNRRPGGLLEGKDAA